MAGKKILLVEDNYDQIMRIQESLGALPGQHSLHVAHNINDALQVLMGGSSQYGMENYRQTGKVRPEIVLMNIGFLQHSAREFLEVMNKYYSLQSTKVYIFGAGEERLDPQLASKYRIAGYLPLPINFHDHLNESVTSFRNELCGSGKALFSLPFFALNKKIVAFLNYLKAKTAMVVVGQTAVAKVTVSAVAAVLAAGALGGSVDRKELADSHAATIPAPAAQVGIGDVSEQEAVVAAESFGLPDIRNLAPRERKQAVKKQKTVPQAQNEEQQPRRNFRIVAVPDSLETIVLSE